MVGYFRENHEIHRRRRGRNLGLGLVLVAFVALIFGLTVVKVTQTGFQVPPDGLAPAAGEARP